jgi:hypothetical protein
MKSTMKKIFLSFIFVFLGFEQVQAEFQLKAFKRLAVFPIAEAQYSTSEDAWWQMREFLTKEQRFLVASRRFMVNRGVFQARKTLKPADAIILGKIMEAEALVVSWIEDRTMKMKVYDGQNGFIIWQGEINFHPAISINDQLIRVAGKISQDFISAIPWQGLTVVNNEIKNSAQKVVYEKDGKSYSKVFVGTQKKYAVGDPVQWIEAKGDISNPFLNSGLKIEIIAEGEIKSQEGDTVEVEMIRMRDVADIVENSLVRFPRDLTQLRDLYTADEKSSTLTSEYLSAEMKDPKSFSKDHHPSSTALGFIGNLALFILLAF